MGTFAISTITKIAAWVVAAIIVVLNLKLFIETATGWIDGTNNIVVKGLIVLFMVLVGVVLLITIVYPFILKRRAMNISVHESEAHSLADVAIEPFRKIALALDYGKNDKKILQYAMQLGTGANLVLIHVVESVSAKIMGSDADDYETRKDQDHLDEYVTILESKGYSAEGVLGFKNRTDEIARIIKEHKCDLLIIGSHGHKTIKDLVFGETINTVRHLIDIPVFIAR